MYFKTDRLVIIAIALLSLVLFFIGFSDKKESTPPNTTLQDTGVNMTDLTYEKVEELNKKSNLLGLTLLDSAPSGMILPGPETIGTSPDYFNCFLFDGKDRITQIGLLSKSANVFGIAVGNSLSQVESILTSEGFKQLEAEETKSLINKNEKALAYRTGYLTLIFYIGENESTTDDATIIKILINVDNPSEDKPTF